MFKTARWLNTTADFRLLCPFSRYLIDLEELRCFLNTKAGRAMRVKEKALSQKIMMLIHSEI